MVFSIGCANEGIELNPALTVAGIRNSFPSKLARMMASARPKRGFGQPEGRAAPRRCFADQDIAQAATKKSESLPAQSSGGASADDKIPARRAIWPTVTPKTVRQPISAIVA